MIFALLFLVFFIGCASSHVQPFSDECTLIRDYERLLTSIDSIAEAEPQFSVKTAGVVRYGEMAYPVRVLEYTPMLYDHRKILITGGVHGNEPVGVKAALQDARLVSNLRIGARVFIIPCVNPWGWVHDKRFNKEGRDINRDFASYKSQEATLIRDFVKNNEFDLIIDHHEDPAGEGFYMYQYGKPDQSLCRQIIDKIGKTGFPVEQNVKMVILKTDDGLIDAPMWGLHYMKLTHQLSITNYLRLNNSEDVYTLESPTRLKMEDRLMMHKIASEILIKEYFAKGKK